MKHTSRRIGRGATSARHFLRRLRTQSTQRFLAPLEIISTHKSRKLLITLPPLSTSTPRPNVGRVLDPAAPKASPPVGKLSPKVTDEGIPARPQPRPRLPRSRGSCRRRRLRRLSARPQPRPRLPRSRGSCRRRRLRRLPARPQPRPRLPRLRGSCRRRRLRRLSARPQPRPRLPRSRGSCRRRRLRRVSPRARRGRPTAPDQ